MQMTLFLSAQLGGPRILGQLMAMEIFEKKLLYVVEYHYQLASITYELRLIVYDISGIPENIGGSGQMGEFVEGSIA